MRKIKEVLRLHFELGMGQRKIARSCAISQSTVHEYLKAAAAAGVSWPLPEDWDERQLEAVVFGKTPPGSRSTLFPIFVPCKISCSVIRI